MLGQILMWPILHFDLWMVLQLLEGELVKDDDAIDAEGRKKHYWFICLQNQLTTNKFYVSPRFPPLFRPL